jgi:uncharacterized membrane protein YidH (DUF202 family)
MTQKPSKFEYALEAGSGNARKGLVASLRTSRAFFVLEVAMRNLLIFLAGVAAILLTVIVDTKLHDEPSSFSFLLIGIIACAVALSNPQSLARQSNMPGSWSTGMDSRLPASIFCASTMACG